VWINGVALPTSIFCAGAWCENLHRAGVVFVVTLPDAFAEFGAAEGAAGDSWSRTWSTSNSRGESAISRPGARHAAVKDVHDKIAGLEQIGGGGGGAAAAEGFDAGDNVLHREGLGEVVVGAALKAFDAVAGDFAAGGQDQRARGTGRGAEPEQGQ